MRPICYVLTALVVSLSPAALAAPDAAPKASSKAATDKAAATPKAPASQPAAAPTVPGEPQTAAEAVELAKQGVEFAKARNWLGLSSIAIFLIVFVLKLTKIFEKIGKRWLYIIVPLLGVAAMLLSALAGGVSWSAAWLVLTSGPCAALLSDFVKRGILAQEPTTPMKPPAA